MTTSENKASRHTADWLQRQIEAGKTPGLYYAFFDAEKTLFEYMAGKADLKTAAPVTPSTAFYGFSATKTFTATAVMQLAEEGKIRLDDPVKVYWPDFPYGGAITVRHLLSHSGGLSNPLPISWVHRTEDHEGFDEHAFFAQVFHGNPKVRFAPNEKFVYTNLGYIALARVIEQVTRLSYRQYVEEHILTPLEVRDTLGFERKAHGGTATGYQKTFSFGNLLLGFLLDRKKFMGEKTEGWSSFQPFYVNGPAYGGLIGTPAGFITFLRDFLRPGGGLLSPESRREMFRENHLNNGRASGMCLSWFTGNLNGHRFYCHAGGGGGFYCELRVYPEAGRGSVLFTNRTGFSDERLLNQTDAGWMA